MGILAMVMKKFNLLVATTEEDPDRKSVPILIEYAPRLWKGIDDKELVCYLHGMPFYSTELFDECGLIYSTYDPNVVTETNDPGVQSSMTKVN